MDPRKPSFLPEQDAEEPSEVQDYYEAMQIEWLAADMARGGDEAVTSDKPSKE
jgi:hypothetical protein